MNKPQRSYRAAVSALVIACSLWGTSFLFGKIAFAELTVSQVVLYRFTVASLVLLSVAWVRGARLRTRDIPLFLVTGFLTVPVTFLLQFGGLALTSAARASLMIGCVPPLLALGAALFHGEQLSLRGWSAVGASTFGIMLIVGPPTPGASWLGDGLVFLSLVTTVAWVLLSKRLSQQYSGLTATTYILAFGTLTLLPISLRWDGLPHASVSVGVWAAVLVLGLFCTALAFALWNWALERIPAARAGVFVNLEPLIGAILGVAILHDAVGPATVLGGILVLLAAWSVSQLEGVAAHDGWNGKTARHVLAGVQAG